MITINEVRGDPLEVNTAYATDDTSADESSEEEVPLPRRSARRQETRPVCDHEITVGGSETEMQNPQTAVCDEPSGIHRSKRPRVVYCRLREFSNRTRLDENKTSGEPNEREMKCDNEAV